MKSRKKLTKAQKGMNQGPLTQANYDELNKLYPSTAPVPIPFAKNEANLIRGFNRYDEKLGDFISNEQRESEDRLIQENRMRNPKYTPGFNQGGSVIKGSQLRRQASSKGLRTSKKHK
jgi:hypothetical protein